jgi:DNA-binding CsgD family transcriptional regulator
LIAQSGDAMTRITYDLPEQLAHIEGAAAAVLSRIGPHFRRALDATAWLQRAKVSEAILQAMIEQIGAAAVVMNSGRRILYANRRAITLLEGGSMVRERPAAGLAFVSHAAQDLFQRALSNCFDITGNTAVASFMVDASNGEPHPIRILPLRLSPTFATAPGSRLVLVLIGPDCAKPSHAVLKELYGLSRAEATVALCIADGGNLKTVASNLGVALSTARNQLAAAMAKINVHRQAELVSRLAGLAPGVNCDPGAGPPPSY